MAEPDSLLLVYLRRIDEKVAGISRRIGKRFDLVELPH
jgi:hypothetical protein